MPKSPVIANVSLPASTRLRWTPTEARAVVAAHEASGLSLEQFAEREGLKPERVARWRRKLKKVKATTMAPPKLKLIELRPARAGLSRIEVVLRSGHVLFVGESFDPASLGRILDLLNRDTSC